MFCRKCGTQLPDDALFCSNCGEKTNVSGAIEPNANAANTNVSSGNGNGNKNIIIGVIVAAIVACCAFFYVNYNSSFVPDFISKDLKFTWNDDLDSISKKYQKWTFKKGEYNYIVQPSISEIEGVGIKSTSIKFAKDNDKKLKKLYISFDLNLPKRPLMFDPLTNNFLPRDVANKEFDRFRIQAAIADEIVKTKVNKVYSALVNHYGNKPKATTRKYNSFITDEWIWHKDDSVITLEYRRSEDKYDCIHLLSLSFDNPKYYE